MTRRYRRPTATVFLFVSVRLFLFMHIKVYDLHGEQIIFYLKEALGIGYEVEQSRA